MMREMKGKKGNVYKGENNFYEGVKSRRSRNVEKY
jgi:hypothetical protein